MKVVSYLLKISLVLGFLVGYCRLGDYDKRSVILSSINDCDPCIDTYYPSYQVLATKYNPVPEQCDEDPLITADNSLINLDKLNNHDLRWIAVSRDLLDIFNYGDTVVIDSENHRLNGEWIVHDTMNKRFSNRIDFLVPLNDRYEFHKPLTLNIRKK